LSSLSELKNLIEKIEDPANIRLAYAASGPYPLRVAFDRDDTVQKILKFKGEAGNAIVTRLNRRKDKKIEDISLACFGYVLEKIGYEEAPKVMVGLLKDLAGRRDIAFAQHFATHALKVLTAQQDLNLVNYAYSERAIEDAIERFRTKERDRRVQR